MIVNEQMLIVSPALASSIGLEEAILVQFLASCTAVTPNQWVALDDQTFTRLFPFWSSQDVVRYIESLKVKKLIAIRGMPFSAGGFDFCLLSDDSPALSAPNDETEIQSSGQNTF